VSLSIRDAPPGAGPESIAPVIEFGAELQYRGYGFRAHRFALPRNDEHMTLRCSLQNVGTRVTAVRFSARSSAHREALLPCSRREGRILDGTSLCFETCDRNDRGRCGACRRCQCRAAGTGLFGATYGTAYASRRARAGIEGRGRSDEAAGGPLGPSLAPPSLASPSQGLAPPPLASPSLALSIGVWPAKIKPCKNKAARERGFVIFRDAAVRSGGSGQHARRSPGHSHGRAPPRPLPARPRRRGHWASSGHRQVYADCVDLSAVENASNQKV
jgi:hypothetical protein